MRGDVAEGDLVLGLAGAVGVEVDGVDFDAVLLVELVEVGEVLLEDGHDLFVVGDDGGVPRYHDAAGGCRQQDGQQQDGADFPHRLKRFTPVFLAGRPAG